MDPSSASLLYRIQSVNQELANASSRRSPPAAGYTAANMTTATTTTMLQQQQPPAPLNTPSTFDPMLHARLSPSSLDPSSFSAQFILPRFAAGGAVTSSASARTIVESDLDLSIGYGGAIKPTVILPFSTHQQQQQQLSAPSTPPGLPAPSSSSSSSSSFVNVAAAIQQQQSRQPSLSPFLTIPSMSTADIYAAAARMDLINSNPSSSSSSSAATSSASSNATHMLGATTTTTTTISSGSSSSSSSSSDAKYAAPDLSDAVYAPYGSSIVSINPTPYKPSPTFNQNNSSASSSSFFNSSKQQQAVSHFSPEALGLPIPPLPGTSTNFAGLYSSSGFDILSVLARVVSRANPVINIGPVDTSCAFLVVDARKWDCPIVFASETFTKLTGYGSEEIIGRNCRFLQSPDGIVAPGSVRKYTDMNATIHMKSHIASGKESQSSLINYMKGGKPFINLVTIIPISWDTEEIAYYIGFQVDLVDQPNAILDRMKDGTYVVNYSLLNNPPPPKLPLVKQSKLNLSIQASELQRQQKQQQHQQQQQQQQQQQLFDQAPSLSLNPSLSEEWSLPSPLTNSLRSNTLSLSLQQNAVSNLDPTNLLQTQIAVELTVAEKLAREVALIERVTEVGETAQARAEMGKEMGLGMDAFGIAAMMGNGLGEEEKRMWCRLLLDHVDDFIHVISLKGAFLYASPSAERILEYDPTELLDLTLPTLLHPADVVSVMRELKEAGTGATSSFHPIVSLLYRIRRKRNGWIWIEAKGRMYVEPGKGRKCIILTARPQEVYQMSWDDLRSAGGLGETEFWVKLSQEGMVLGCTKAVQSVLGFLMEEMVGTSIFQLIKTDQAPAMRAALLDCADGKSVSVHYPIKSRRGYVDVVSRFYPRLSSSSAGTGADEDQMELDDPSAGASTHLSIIVQTNEYSSEQRKLTSSYGAAAPAWSGAPPSTTIPLLPLPAAPLTTAELSDPFTYDTPSTTTTTTTSAPTVTVAATTMSTTSTFTSTFKTLVHPSTLSDNVFDELDAKRCTSWQFEYHQLKTVNKQLREEREILLNRKLARAAARKNSGSGAFYTSSLSTDLSTSANDARSNIGASGSALPSVGGAAGGAAPMTGSSTGRRGGSVSKHGSEGGNSSKSTRREGGCANCGRLDSPEWRAGPTGTKSLCNACGLRWAKSQRGSSAGSALSSLSTLTANAAAAPNPATTRNAAASTSHKSGMDPSSGSKKDAGSSTTANKGRKRALSDALSSLDGDGDLLSPGSIEDAASPVAWR